MIIGYELGSTRRDIDGIFQRLIKDEQLLRLLNYLPEEVTNIDPLDESLPDLVDEDSEDYWTLVESRIRLTEKTSDLITKPKCIIYIGLGRRRPVFGNHILVTQEILVNVYVHENFETDLRHSRILDRINDLIVMRELAGVTRLDYIAGNPRVSPPQYTKYEHIYGYVTSKGASGDIKCR